MRLGSKRESGPAKPQTPASRTPCRSGPETRQPSHSRSPSRRRTKADTGHGETSANHPLWLTPENQIPPDFCKALGYDGPTIKNRDPPPVSMKTPRNLDRVSRSARAWCENGETNVIENKQSREIGDSACLMISTPYDLRCETFRFASRNICIRFSRFGAAQKRETKMAAAPSSSRSD